MSEITKLISNTMNSHKLVVVGDGGVGKSSIVYFLVSGKFRNYAESTVGAAYCRYTHQITLQDSIAGVRYDIWDTAGQDRYFSLVPLYLREASVVLMVYDAGDPDTYSNLVNKWMPFVERNASNRRGPIIKVMVENKSELATPEQTAAARKYAEEHDLLFFQTSPRNGTGLFEMMRVISEKIAGEKIPAYPPPAPLVVTPISEQKPSGYKCFGSCYH